MMRGRDALFVGDSQVRHVYAAFLRIAAIGDAHEAHLHPPKRPKLKNSLFNRKYRVYVKSARKTNRNVADEVEEQNIETEVVGDVPGDKHAKTDPLKHRNWTFAIQGGGARTSSARRKPKTSLKSSKSAYFRFRWRIDQRFEIRFPRFPRRWRWIMAHAPPSRS